MENRPLKSYLVSIMFFIYYSYLKDKTPGYNQIMSFIFLVYGYIVRSNATNNEKKQLFKSNSPFSFN
ncbi:hypothetical protein BpHYR1_008080 [Brachionus plicatilis]|uniref:Uncharacterized protein n=1 Tax=Brachionus plicatilis TaxID=10195 RepID=A0A3M7RQQ1_BRAPC|nr:hypothetical protein BpHYR1_008080 [Brachionus plicatilis]